MSHREAAGQTSQKGRIIVGYDPELEHASQCVRNALNEAIMVKDTCRDADPESEYVSGTACQLAMHAKALDAAVKSAKQSFLPVLDEFQAASASYCAHHVALTQAEDVLLVLRNAAQYAGRDAMIESTTDDDLAGAFAEAMPLILEQVADRHVAPRRDMLALTGPELSKASRFRQQSTERPAGNGGDWLRSCGGEVTKLEMRILQHMAKRKKATIDELARAAWDDPPTDEAVRTAVRRLSDKLLAERLKPLGISLEYGSGFFTLEVNRQK